MSKLLRSTVGCVDCKLKFSYAQNNQEHATGDGSQIVTTRRVVSCIKRRVGAARLLLVRFPWNSRSSVPTYRFAGAAQVHRL